MCMFYPPPRPCLRLGLSSPLFHKGDSLFRYYCLQELSPFPRGSAQRARGIVFVCFLSPSEASPLAPLILEGQFICRERSIVYSFLLLSQCLNSFFPHRRCNGNRCAYNACNYHNKIADCAHDDKMWYGLVAPSDSLAYGLNAH